MHCPCIHVQLFIITIIIGVVIIVITIHSKLDRNLWTFIRNDGRLTDERWLGVRRSENVPLIENIRGVVGEAHLCALITNYTVVIRINITMIIVF